MNLFLINIQNTIFLKLIIKTKNFLFFWYLLILSSPLPGSHGRNSSLGGSPLNSSSGPNSSLTKTSSSNPSGSSSSSGSLNTSGRYGPVEFPNQTSTGGEAGGLSYKGKLSIITNIMKNRLIYLKIVYIIVIIIF